MSISIEEFTNVLDLSQVNGIYIIRVPSNNMLFASAISLCDDLQKAFSVVSKQRVVFIPDAKHKFLASEFLDDRCSHVIDFNMPPFTAAKRKETGAKLVERIRRVNKDLKFIFYVNNNY